MPSLTANLVVILENRSNIFYFHKYAWMKKIDNIFSFLHIGYFKILAEKLKYVSIKRINKKINILSIFYSNSLYVIQSFIFQILFYNFIS